MLSRKVVSELNEWGWACSTIGGADAISGDVCCLFDDRLGERRRRQARPARRHGFIARAFGAARGPAAGIRGARGARRGAGVR